MADPLDGWPSVSCNMLPGTPRRAALRGASAFAQDSLVLLCVAVCVTSSDKFSLSTIIISLI